MPDYNPAVATGIQPPQQQNWAGTLGTVANIQAEQARTGLYNLQALQQQRQYNALQSYAAEMRSSGNSARALQAYSDSGGNPEGLGQLAGAASQMTFMGRHGGLNPQGAEAGANIARTGAETTNLGIQADINRQKLIQERNTTFGQIGSQLVNDQSDATYNAVSDQLHSQHISPQEQANFDAAKTPEQRLAFGRRLLTAAYPEKNLDLHNVGPTERVVTPYSALPGSQTTQAAAPGIPAAMTPGEVESQKATVEYLQGEGAKAYASNQSLMQSMKVVDNDIERLGPNWMGPGSSAKTESLRALNAGLTQLGVKPIAADVAGSSEELGKESIRAGYQLGSSQFGGSKEASQTIQTSIKAVVSQGNSYIGAKMVSATIQAATQRNIDLYEYQNAHRNQSPNVSAIEFNKLHPPQEYAMRGIVNGIPQTDRQYLMKNPALAPRFDKAFGPGVSQAILGQQ